MTGATRAFAILFVVLHVLALFAFTLRWLWVAMLAMALLIHAARAHSWYDPECCSDQDCFPVEVDDVIETAEGWKHLPTGTVFSKEQVKPSKDNRFHVCIGNKPHDMGRAYCIYVLQGT
jgi:hypothetical protein